jgi:hypothetical protein
MEEGHQSQLRECCSLHRQAILNWPLKHNLNEFSSKDEARKYFGQRQAARYELQTY